MEEGGLLSGGSPPAPLTADFFRSMGEAIGREPPREDVLSI